MRVLSVLVVVIVVQLFPGTAGAADTGTSMHDFLYCGEYQHQSLDNQSMYIVRGGKVVWSYTSPKRGEFSDCTLLPNGNVLAARQFGAIEITPDKRLVWDYDSPPGTELHTVVPYGPDQVALIENGHPALLKIMRKSDSKVIRSLQLETGAEQSVHIQFRRLRILPNGNFLIAHLNMGKVIEYKPDGTKVWSVDAAFPWSATRLPNGNTLIGAHRFAREVDPSGKTVWEIGPNDIPGMQLNLIQEVSRLSNGDTIINNWIGSKPLSEWAGSPQVIEITPNKEVKWILSDWNDLGPASGTQILDKGLQQWR